MKSESLKRAIKRFLFLATTSVPLIAALSVNAHMQSRGGTRSAGVGGVRPVGSATRPTGRIIVVNGGRPGSIDDFPLPTGRDRRIPELERTRRAEEERREHERARERRLHEEQRREETRRGEVIRRREEEANRFQKLGRWLGVSPERLQSFFQEAKAANPDLRLSQFFASLVIANRLNGSYPKVEPQAILRGLDSGMSLERTLVALGVSAEEAKAAVKWAERVVNQLKP